MNNEAHVRLVYTHAERDGGDHDHPLLAEEAFLMLRAHLGGQARVIGQCRSARELQRLCRLLHLLPTHAIDHACFFLVIAEERVKLTTLVCLGRHSIANLRAIEAGDETRRAIELQALGDLLAIAHVGCGGERHARHAGKALAQRVQAQVVRAEVVTPLRDAVGLVDGDEGELHPGEPRSVCATVCEQTFRRDVKKVHIAGAQAFDDVALVPAVEGRVQVFGAQAQFAQCRDLVLHQRYEWGDDQPGTRSKQRRHLIGTLRDLPAPVGMSTSASRPLRAASITSRCWPRKAS